MCHITMISPLARPARILAVSALLASPAAIAEQPPLVAARVERTFGVSAHPDSLLQAVRDIGVGVNGQIVVLDDMARNLKVFDSTGVLRRVIGRRGAGPAEFISPIAVAVTRDGRIFVPEGGRVQSFSPTGTLLTSFKPAPLGEVPLGYGVSNDGAFYMATALFTTALDMNPRRDSATAAASLARGPATNSIDSLIRLRSWRPNGDSSVVFLSTGAPPLAIDRIGAPLWSRNASGTMVVSSGATPAFRFYSADGRFVRAIPAPSAWRATPISAGDLDVLIDKSTESTPAEAREMARRLLRRRGLGSEYPAYVAVVLADDGSIWVRPPVTAADIRSGRVKTFDMGRNLGLAEWHVLSSTGALRMRLSVPEGFQLRHVIGDRLYGSGLNANDELVVQVLRVPASR